MSEESAFILHLKNSPSGASVENTTGELLNGFAVFIIGGQKTIYILPQ